MFEQRRYPGFGFVFVVHLVFHVLYSEHVRTARHALVISSAARRLNCTTGGCISLKFSVLEENVLEMRSRLSLSKDN